MKRLLAVAFLLFSFAAHAQLPADSASGKVVYRGAVKLPASVSSAQAYGRAKLWLADAFASKTLLAEDAGAGLLSGAGLFTIRGFEYTFRVRLQIENNLVRYRLDEFMWHSFSPSDQGTAEQQRDSKLAIGRGTRTKMLAELDAKVRASLAKLPADLTANL